MRTRKAPAVDMGPRLATYSTKSISLPPTCSSLGLWWMWLEWLSCLVSSFLCSFFPVSGTSMATRLSFSSPFLCWCGKLAARLGGFYRRAVPAHRQICDYNTNVIMALKQPRTPNVCRLRYLFVGYKRTTTIIIIIIIDSTSSISNSMFGLCRCTYIW